jgi:hypothetical protein
MSSTEYTCMCKYIDTMTRHKTTKSTEGLTPRRGRIWVLDTETKGTGAEMVPLERTLKREAPRTERIKVIRRKPRRSSIDAPEPTTETPETGPRRFKVVDVLSREVLAEDASTQATLELLKERRSVVDVRVYLWEDHAEDWRALTLSEQQALRDLRDR